MSYAIQLFGVLILIAGTLILIKPDSFFSLISNSAESVGLQIFAVVVRVILGIALITYAAESKFPVVLQVIGWLSLIAAALLALIGRHRFKSLIRWAISHTSSFGRFTGLFAVLFGGFLVYAV